MAAPRADWGFANPLWDRLGLGLWIIAEPAKIAILWWKIVLRIGLGHDTHRLVGGGPLRLGGIDIPFDRRMDGHSDADVLLHAITDALLGAAGDEDIGQLFPDTVPANAGRDSAQMLSYAWQRVRNQGWSLVNLDCVVFAERPKIAPYKQLIRTRIAEILSVDVACCGLKAKTGESIGDIGCGRAIAAQCVALLTST